MILYDDPTNDGKQARQQAAAQGAQADHPSPRPVDPSGADRWTARLLRDDESGNPRSCLANVILVFRESDEWADVLGFDDFTKAPMALSRPPWPSSVRTPNVPYEWSDSDTIRACEWLQANHGMMVGKRTVNDAMAVVAQEHRFHAVRNFLDGLEWDGEERIEYWTTTHLGAEPATTTHAFGRRFLISAVSRIYQPGSKADTVLVLEGEEGTLRSTAFSVLAGDKWFTDQLPDIRSEDADLLLLGKWFVEIADMDTFKGIRSPAVAQFLTRRVDRYRPSSGRVVDVPRGIVFVATANCADDLYDETGGLTFWPVAVGDIDIPKLRADRDQLWAEAVVRYKAGEPWCMDNEEQTRPHYDSAEIGGPFSRSYVPARDKRTLPTTFLRRAGLPCRA